VRKGFAALTGAILCGAGLALPAAAARETVSSSTCSGGSVTWRADYATELTGFGPLVRVNALTKLEGGVETDAASMTWEWRLDDGAYPLRMARGPLRPATRAGWQGREWQSVLRSPRIVAPDGACQIYLSPFVNPHGRSSWPRVAVLGDSLVASLNDLYYNVRYPQGFVEGVLNAHGMLAEVEGQAGRRWTPWGTDPLAAADSYLLDEFRGLEGHGMDAVVVALGANDAGSLVYVTPPDQVDSVRSQVHSQLTEELTEMAASTCVVAVTTVENPVTLLGVPSGPAFPREAAAINGIVKDLAASDPDDGLHVFDFAAEAKAHQYGSRDSWFVADNLHLNATGRLVYADVMWRAAQLCEPGTASPK
jgi:lysophospholipase L1-like esterase